ncbi:MAG: lytic transglycosylase domain-containing protein [Rickettsiales bacterium]|nr:lytic transglycosylase domain-containing protein [Rickettsiales bacterium]
MRNQRNITYIACLVLLGFGVAKSLWHVQGAIQSLANGKTIAESTETQLPVILSGTDRLLYKEIFQAQKRADWQQADIFIEKLSDPILLGQILADRYLHRKYNTTPAELLTWLKNYPDHPKYEAIVDLAQAKNLPLPTQITRDKISPLSGYGDDNGLNRAPEAVASAWRKAIDAWKNNEAAKAAAQFKNIYENKDIASPWIKSGAAYWASRAYEKLGHAKQSDKYLNLAAEEPRSFYGILARKRLGMGLELDAAPIVLTQAMLNDLMDIPAIKRTIAFSECDQFEYAEKELRAWFPNTTPAQKQQLLALAHKMQLASVQISIARYMSGDDRNYDLARYPTPHWTPQYGFIVDPALIYALTRQESGFNAKAQSGAGALGLMQLMPQTASLMKKTLMYNPDVVSESVLNITLGQNYVDHLLGNSLVEDNLIYLLVAYNAGAGRLKDWKERLTQDDPLLFIESIPFGETRNYVMQVMANYWIYSELSDTPNLSAYALADNQWPSYDRSLAPVAKLPAPGKEG